MNAIVAPKYDSTVSEIVWVNWTLALPITFWHPYARVNLPTCLDPAFLPNREVHAWYARCRSTSHIDTLSLRSTPPVKGGITPVMIHTFPWCLVPDPAKWATAFWLQSSHFFKNTFTISLIAACFSEILGLIKSVDSKSKHDHSTINWVYQTPWNVANSHQIQSFLLRMPLLLSSISKSPSLASTEIRHWIIIATHRYLASSEFLELYIWFWSSCFRCSAGLSVSYSSLF